ncbi:MAG: hypothetical protein ACJAT1_001690 [Marivirga sp.]|jgi:hypothetical protein
MEAGEGIGMNKPGKYPGTLSSFKIVNNKRYLFFDASIFHAKEKWEMNESKFIDNANSAWKEMKNELPPMFRTGYWFFLVDFFSFRPLSLIGGVA